jgi:hypothetical protein
MAGRTLWTALLLAILLAPLAARAQVQPGVAPPPPEAVDEDEEEDELPLWMGAAGVGFSMFVFNQTNAGPDGLDTSTAVAAPGLAVHLEGGRRFGQGSHFGLVLAAELAGASADAVSRYTAGAALLGLGVRWDPGDGLRATLGLGAGALALRRSIGDQSAISLAPFGHFDFPVFHWLHWQGTFSYLPVPAPLRAFYADIGFGIVL